MAKWIASHFKDKYGRKDWFEIRDKVMKWCLRVKLASKNDTLGRLLDSTGEKFIVEESRKDSYWGTKRVDQSRLKGVNRLGRLLMALRDEYRGASAAHIKRVMPPKVENFKLLGRRIGRIDF